MHGDLGNKLVQHAKRTQTLPRLPAYQTELVRAVAREVTELDRDVHRLLEQYQSQSQGSGGTQSSFNPASDPATACKLLIDHLSMRRNKRCLLAYHRVRAERLEAMCWEGKDIDILHPMLPNSHDSYNTRQADGRSGGGDTSTGEGNGGAGASLTLSPEEQEYFRQYNDLLSGFKGHWTDIDLTGSLEPPRDLFIDVRVLKDAGEIQTEYGVINLTKNSQFFVRLGDVERLIAQGFLQRLT